MSSSSETPYYRLIWLNNQAVSTQSFPFNLPSGGSQQFLDTENHYHRPEKGMNLSIKIFQTLPRGMIHELSWRFLNFQTVIRIYSFSMNCCKFHIFVVLTLDWKWTKLQIDKNGKIIFIYIWAKTLVEGFKTRFKIYIQHISKSFLWLKHSGSQLHPGRSLLVLSFFTCFSNH